MHALKEHCCLLDCETVPEEISRFSCNTLPPLLYFTGFYGNSRTPVGSEPERGSLLILRVCLGAHPFCKGVLLTPCSLAPPVKKPKKFYCPVVDISRHYRALQFQSCLRCSCFFRSQNFFLNIVVCLRTACLHTAYEQRKTSEHLRIKKRYSCASHECLDSAFR